MGEFRVHLILKLLVGHEDGGRVMGSFEVLIKDRLKNINVKSELNALNTPPLGGRGTYGT